MRYTVSRSVIWVVGDIWIPAVKCGQTIGLRQYDLENMANDEGTITRDDVQRWLDRNAMDLSHIDDFSASLEWKGETVDIPWATVEGELAYSDCTCGED